MRRLLGMNGLLLGLLVLLLAGCRPVAVTGDPGPQYTIEVDNRMSHAMVVSFNDGTGERPLGTVAAQSRGHFIIVSPAQSSVTIVARAEGGGHTVQRQVVLVAGTTVTVVL
jgi:hypothetical protein